MNLRVREEARAWREFRNVLEPEKDELTLNGQAVNTITDRVQIGIASRAGVPFSTSVEVLQQHEQGQRGFHKDVFCSIPEAGSHPESSCYR